MAIVAGVMAASSLLGKAGGLVSGVKSLFGGGGLSTKDKERLARAQSHLNQALAGDGHALAEIKRLAVDPVQPAFTNKVYTEALAAYNASSPVIPTSMQPAPTPLQEVISDANAKARDAYAEAAQKIGAAATDVMSDKIASDNRKSQTIPLTRNQLFALGALAGLIVFLRR